MAGFEEHGFPPAGGRALKTLGVLTPPVETEEEPRATGTTVRRIDLHARRSVIVRMTPEGEKLEVVRIENDRWR